MDRNSQDGGGSKSDPYQGWQGHVSPNAPDGGGGPGKFKSYGPLMGTQRAWHGLPHPQAPAARYLAIADHYSGLSGSAHVVVEDIDGVFYVSLTAAAAMRPFIRTFKERFETTVQRVAAKKHLAVVINGNMYRDKGNFKLARHVLGNLGIPTGTQAAGDTVPNGIVRGRGQQIGGTHEPLMFYVSWTEGPLGGYTFGQGDPPGDPTSALGGLGPVIIGGLKYGPHNVYRAGVPAGAPTDGDPGEKYRGFLTVRSNKTYASLAADGASVGKVIIGKGTGDRPLRIVVQPHGGTGQTLDQIRDKLFNEGVTDAVFLDGSDSAMLFANGKFYVHQGGYKDRTNTVGIGFQLPFVFIDSPGRSMGHIA